MKYVSLGDSMESRHQKERYVCSSPWLQFKHVWLKHRHSTCTNVLVLLNSKAMSPSWPSFSKKREHPLNPNMSVQFITHPCCPVSVMPAFSRLLLQAMSFSFAGKKPVWNIIKGITAQKNLLMAKPSCQSTSHRLLCWVWNVKTANRDVQVNAGVVVFASSVPQVLSCKMTA